MDSQENQSSTQNEKIIEKFREKWVSKILKLQIILITINFLKNS
jgi:hypothetical protein